MSKTFKKQNNKFDDWDDSSKGNKKKAVNKHDRKRMDRALKTKNITYFDHENEDAYEDEETWYKDSK